MCTFLHVYSNKWFENLGPKFKYYENRKREEHLYLEWFLKVLRTQTLGLIDRLGGYGKMEREGHPCHMVLT